MEEYLQAHHVDFFKDIILPNLSIDKWVAVISLIILIRTFIKSNKIAILNFDTQLATSHRDIWSKIISDVDLQEIANPDNATVSFNDIDAKQRRYVNFIIINTCLAYNAHKLKIRRYPFEAQTDTGSFFNKPIPNLIWENTKKYYEKDFVEFIDSSKKYALNGSRGKNFFRRFLHLIFIAPLKWIYYKSYQVFKKCKNWLLSFKTFIFGKKSVVFLERDSIKYLREKNIKPDDLINDYLRSYVERMEGNDTD